MKSLFWCTWSGSDAPQPLHGFVNSLFTSTDPMFSNLKAPPAVKFYSLSFWPHLSLLFSLLSWKKHPVLFSTAFSEIHPSLPSSFALFSFLSPSLPVLQSQCSLCFLVDISPSLFLLYVPPLLTPISLISLWCSCHCENMICSYQTANYTLLHSHHALSPPYGPCICSLAYRAPTAPIGHGPASKITWRV